MRADTFEFIIDDKDFGVAGCIACAVAYSDREKWWQNWLQLYERLHASSISQEE